MENGFARIAREILRKTRKMMVRNLIIESFAIINIICIMYFLSTSIEGWALLFAYLYLLAFIIYRTSDVLSIIRQLRANRKLDDESLLNLKNGTEKSFARSFFIKVIMDSNRKDRKIEILKDKISIIQSAGTMFPKNTLKIFFTVISMLFLYSVSTMFFLSYWTGNPDFIFDSETFFWVYKIGFTVISVTLVGFLYVLWRIIWGSKVVDICMSCRSVHWNERWTQFEEFIGSSTHTICPRCTVQKIERNANEDFQGILARAKEARRNPEGRGYRGRDANTQAD